MIRFYWNRKSFNHPEKNCYIINFRLARKCQSARNAKKKSTLVSSHCQFKNLIEILAEKVTSLGKDWHRPCLRCEKCNKVGFPKNRVHHEKFQVLSSGSHAENDGKPYCHRPCYAALFGPKGFGRGGNESHTFNQNFTSTNTVRFRQKSRKSYLYLTSMVTYEFNNKIS